MTPSTLPQGFPFHQEREARLAKLIAKRQRPNPDGPLILLLAVIMFAMGFSIGYFKGHEHGTASGFESGTKLMEHMQGDR
jgi:hypothetical protein